MKSKGRHSSRHAAGKGHKPHRKPFEGGGASSKMMGPSKKPKS